MNMSLRRFTSDELVSIARSYSGDQSQRNTILHKMFEMYEKEKLNEFGRTLIFEKLQNVK